MAYNRDMRRLFAAVLIFLGLLCQASLPVIASKPKYYDVYLTDNRVCKKCAWRVIDENHVELVSSKTGLRGTYHPTEIIGVDKHPVVRRMFYSAVHGNSQAGKIIVPEAFDRPDLPSSAHF